MKKHVIIIALFYAVFCNGQNLQRTWATYFGNVYGAAVRDVTTDSQGNIYLVGSIPSSADYPITTPNCYQPVINGISDGFIVKFNALGELVWGTYFGGNQEDNIEAVRIDRNGNLVLGGYTYSTNGIADVNAYYNNLSFEKDYFLTSFDLDGNKLWGTYLGFGTAQDFQEIPIGITIDLDNNIYLFANSINQNIGTNGTFQANYTNNNSVLAKFSSTGFKIWGTYYGIHESIITSIETSVDGLIVAGSSYDCPEQPFNGSNLNTYFATPNCYQQGPALGNGLASQCSDAFLSKFSVDGQREWSTYIGGSGLDTLGKNTLKTVGSDVYVTGLQYGLSNNMATVGCFQATNLGVPFLAKFDSFGQKLWGTYCGLNNYQQNEPSSVFVDSVGNAYLLGSNGSLNNIATANAYQPALFPNSQDGFVVKFSPTGSRLWGTYYGGTGMDVTQGIYFDSESFYLTGYTSSENMATVNSFDSVFDYVSNSAFTNYFIARFDPTLAITQNQLQTLKIYPNPNNGTFSISNLEKESYIEIYDVLGKKVHEQIINNNQLISMEKVSKGIYFAKIKSGDKVYKTEKIIVE